jgi:hypothetical protein
MRRADAYGPEYTGTDDGQERGLAGHFMCSMLDNQFEFLMSQWVNSATFAGGKALPGSILCSETSETFPTCRTRTRSPTGKTVSRSRYRPFAFRNH